eukprot:3954466-Prymnesium_polylepis.2
MVAAAREVAAVEQVAVRAVALTEVEMAKVRTATGSTAMVQAGHPHTSTGSGSRGSPDCTGSRCQQP